VLSQGARGALAGIGVVGTILVLWGFVVKTNQEDAYHECVIDWKERVRTGTSCVEPNSAGQTLMLLGALMLVGALAAYLAMRSKKQPPTPAA
jgi:predicted membrane-bound mannosyltransferase